MPANSLQARDIASLVHQQTDLHRHATEGAVMIDRGEGVRVWDTDGKEYIEAMAGLWCALAGVQRAAAGGCGACADAETAVLPHVLRQRACSRRWNWRSGCWRSHRPAWRGCCSSAAGRKPMTRRSSWSGTTTPSWAGRRSVRSSAGCGGYHGNTVASVSLSGQPHMHAGFGLPLPGFVHTDNPNYYRFQQDGETEEMFSQRMADNLEALILAEGPDTVGGDVRRAGAGRWRGDHAAA